MSYILASTYQTLMSDTITAAFQCYMPITLHKHAYKEIIPIYMYMHAGASSGDTCWWPECLQLLKHSTVF